MQRAASILAFVVLVILLLALVLILVNRREPGWRDLTSRNPATDEVTRHFRLRASEGDGFLSLTCRAHERIAAILTTDGDVAGAEGGKQAVRLRIDDDAPLERSAAVRGEAIALAASDDPRSSDVISRLAASRRLNVEWGQGAVMFDTIGADDVVSDMRQTCA